VYILRKMKLLLFPLFLAYRLGSQIKNMLYSSGILKAKSGGLTTVSIGNITFGGSEKTPIAMHLISYLAEQGYRPAFISRGYRGNWENAGGTLSDGKSLYGEWKDSGDEPFMVALRFPEIGVFIGKKRFASCKRAKDLGFNCGILDDGFQHRKLDRDLDIVIHDPAEGISLREPLSSLKRAQIILIKGIEEESDLSKIQSRFAQASLFRYSVLHKGFFRIGEKEKISSEIIKGKRAVAFSGIAQPQRFLKSLEKEGIKPAAFLSFPDHYSYPLSSQKKIFAAYRESGSELLLTTEKDSVKISGLKEVKDLPFYYLRIGIEIEENFYSSLLSYLKG
jgi:tetraacyldisaccharide 4'-kinase